MQYIGEHLLPGQIGQFAILMAFVAAVLATVSYFLATQKNDESWQRIGRWAFIAHGIGIFTAAACMFYVMTYIMYLTLSSICLRYSGSISAFGKEETCVKISLFQ